jgi:hypothetical protein
MLPEAGCFVRLDGTYFRFSPQNESDQVVTADVLLRIQDFDNAEDDLDFVFVGGFQCGTSAVIVCGGDRS